VALGGYFKAKAFGGSQPASCAELLASKISANGRVGPWSATGDCHRAQESAAAKSGSEDSPKGIRLAVEVDDVSIEALKGWNFKP
jgi:hypothetical protein